MILLELDLVWLCRKSSQVKCESEDELKLPNPRQIQVKLKSVQDKLKSNFVVLPQIRNKAIDCFHTLLTSAVWLSVWRACFSLILFGCVETHSWQVQCDCLCEGLALVNLVWLCRKSSQIKCGIEDKYVPVCRQIQVESRQAQIKFFVILPQIQVTRLSTVSSALLPSPL